MIEILIITVKEAGLHPGWNIAETEGAPPCCVELTWDLAEQQCEQTETWAWTEHIWSGADSPAPSTALGFVSYILRQRQVRMIGMRAPPNTHTHTVTVLPHFNNGSLVSVIVSTCFIFLILVQWSALVWHISDKCTFLLFLLETGGNGCTCLVWVCQAVHHTVREIIFLLLKQGESVGNNIIRVMDFTQLSSQTEDWAELHV